MHSDTELEGYSLAIVAALVKAGFSDAMIDYATDKIMSGKTSIHPDSGIRSRVQMSGNRDQDCRSD